MRTVLLKDICEIIAGQSPPSSTYNQSGEGLPFFQGKADFGELYPKTRIWCNKPQKVAESGDILISVRAPVGPTNICNQRACIGRGLSAIRSGDSIDNKYLLYFLRKHEQEIAGWGNGSTFSAITQQDIKRIRVPLVSLEEQKRIVTILDLVDVLRQKRKLAIKLLNDYMKSIFLQMFGDPMRNPKCFDVTRIGDITSHIKDGPHVSPEYVDVGISILSTRNIRPGELVLEDVKYVSQDTFEKLTKIFRPQKGDVLVTKGGTTGYAKVVDFDWPFCVWVHLAVLRPTSEIDPLYLEGAMNSDYCYRQSQLYTHGIANRDLGLTRIANIKLLKPPLEEQQKYASIIRSVRLIKQKMLSQSEELDNHFESLMQRAFKGEL